jgi:hypothetical protein
MRTIRVFLALNCLALICLPTGAAAQTVEPGPGVRGTARILTNNVWINRPNDGACVSGKVQFHLYTDGITAHTEVCLTCTYMPDPEIVKDLGCFPCLDGCEAGNVWNPCADLTPSTYPEGPYLCRAVVRDMPPGTTEYGHDEIVVCLDKTPPRVDLVEPHEGACFTPQEDAPLVTVEAQDVGVQVCDNPCGGLKSVCIYLIDADEQRWELCCTEYVECPTDQQVVNCVVEPWPLPTGWYTVEAIALDCAGSDDPQGCEYGHNMNTARALFKVDATPPTVLVEPVPPCNPEEVCWTCDDDPQPPGDIWCQVIWDDQPGPLDPCTPKVPHCVPVPALSECDPHTVKVRCVDACGNETTSAPQTFKVDKTDPTVVIDIPTDNQCNPPELRFTPDDNCPEDLECVIYIDVDQPGEFVEQDRFMWPPGQEKVWPWPTDMECSHIVRVCAEDECGNAGCAEVPFKLDDEDANVVIHIPTDNQCNPPELRFTPNDNCPEDVECVIYIDVDQPGEFVEQDRFMWPPGQEKVWQWPTDLECSHIVRVCAEDECGNAGCAEVPFKLDDEDPIVTIHIPTQSQCNPPELQFTPDDNCPEDLECVIYIDDVERNRCNCVPGEEKSWPWPEDLECWHTVKVCCTDECGNDGCSDERRFKLDDEDPIVTIHIPTDSQCNPPELQFTPDDNCPEDLECVIYIDDAQEDSFNCAPGQLKVWPWPEGLECWHTVQLYVKDECDNDVWSDKRTFIMDEEAPTCEITRPEEGATVSCCPLDFRFIVHDNCEGELTGWVTENGNTLVQPGPYPQDVECCEHISLPDGEHTLVLHVKDHCGHESTCDRTFTCFCESDCPGKAVPNLIWQTGDPLLDPWDGQMKQSFRPEVVNFDELTIRDVLICAGQQIDENLLVQAVGCRKVTPTIKCHAFAVGPGSGLNTNFDTGYVAATSDMLDDSIIYIVFGQALGNRCLLFSPPCTYYEFYVVFVIYDPATGQVGEPITVSQAWHVEKPTKETIRHNIEYFATVAAGRTQKPKISADVAAALYAALDIADDLEALTEFEAVIALASIDFSTFIGPSGTNDVRFETGYLIDSDEEPIGCLLIEQANYLLWKP